MKGNRIVTIEFTGKELESGIIFDTTSEKIAKENKLYKENSIFRPIPVVVGKGDVLKGIDDCLLEMKEGDSKTIQLTSEKAFGARKKELIVVVPIKEFISRKIQPFPGLIVDMNGQYGKVQTVSGGRVRVDMNNELAGKNVEYEIKIVKEYTSPAEKAQIMSEKFFPLKEIKVETKLEKDNLKVKLPKEIAKQIGPLIAPFTQTMKEVIPEIKKVEIVESIDKSKKEEKKAEKKWN